METCLDADVVADALGKVGREEGLASVVLGWEAVSRVGVEVRGARDAHVDAKLVGIGRGPDGLRLRVEAGPGHDLLM